MPMIETSKQAHNFDLILSLLIVATVGFLFILRRDIVKNRDNVICFGISNKIKQIVDSKFYPSWIRG